MALLDDKVPPGSRDITLETLQLCTGHYCVVKYSPADDPGAHVIIVGICGVLYIASTDSEGTFRAQITILKGLGEVIIGSSEIEYIYAVDLPVGPSPDLVAELLGLRSGGTR